MDASLHQAFVMAVDVEECFGDFDTFLTTYEVLGESCPPWVYVVRLFHQRTFEKHQALQAFVHQLMQGAEARRPDA